MRKVIKPLDNKAKRGANIGVILLVIASCVLLIMGVMGVAVIFIVSVKRDNNVVDLGVAIALSTCLIEASVKLFNHAVKMLRASNKINPTCFIYINSIQVKKTDEESSEFINKSDKFDFIENNNPKN